MTKNNKKNFWLVTSPIIFIFVSYGIYLIYHYKSGVYKDFQRRGGETIERKSFGGGNPESLAQKAFNLVWTQTDIQTTIMQREQLNGGVQDYTWRSIALMTSDLKRWNLVTSEYEVKPKIVCHSTVEIKTSKVIEHDCVESER